MGRAFEYRKERKMKRWSAMSRAFTKIGREIFMAAKTGGSDPNSNLRLRTAIINAKAASMPKDNIDAAIKRASNKEEKSLDEIVYEGIGPHGVAFMVETATDNPNRTVANIRVIFSRNDGTLGTSGSVGFMFQRKGVFQILKQNINLDDIELDLIDKGAEDIVHDDDTITIYTDFGDFAQMSKFLEEHKIQVELSELQRIPTTTKEDLTDEQVEEVIALVDKLEEDDDVQNVFHNMA